MSGGSQTTATTTNNSAPWPDAQPYLRSSMAIGHDLNEQGKGFNPYPNSTVVPYASQTTDAMAGIEGIARQGNPLAGASQSNAMGILNSGGMSDMQRQALSGTMDVATGAKSLGMEGDYRGLLGRVGNDAYSKVIDTEAGKLSDDISRSIDMGGRLGSNAHIGALTEGVGNFRSKAAAENWNANNQMEAGILGQITAGRGADIANMVGAGSQAFNAGDTAATQAARYSALAPSIYQDQFAPYQQLAGVGAQHEDLASRELQDQISKFTANDQSPWSRLAAANAIYSGAGQLGGSSTQTAMQPRNLGGGILGGAMTGATLGNALFPGAGLLGGGALGGLLGLF